MRSTSLIAPRALPSTLFASAAVAVTLGVAGCGPSQLSQDYDAYMATVDPALEQESERWNRIATLIQERQNDYSSPRYYEYLQDTAVAYYTELRDTFVALEPDGQRIAAAHQDLLRFLDARLEFVHVELSGREVFRDAVGEHGLLAVLSGLQEAENLRYEYQEAVGEDVPDAILGELYSLVDTFRRKYFDPMQKGAMDPEDVQMRLKRHVIPSLQALKARKYRDDERGRLLKACVSAWLQWHERLERTCPLLQRVWRIKAKSEAAAQEAQTALDAFKKSLDAIRRDR